jgi:integrase
MAERLLPMQARAEGDTLVFVDPKGDPFNGAHITERALKPLLRPEGLRGIRFHDLRHAFATLRRASPCRSTGT